MKKIFTLSLALAGFCGYANAEVGDTFKAEGFTFTISSEDEMTVKAGLYEGEEAEVTVPSKVTNPDNGKTYTVTALRGCFKQKKNLKKVTLPNTIEILETNSFYKNDSIKEIVWPESSLKAFGMQAIYYNDGFEELILPNSIDSVASYSCSNSANLKKLVLPENLWYIGKSAFSGNKVLTSVTIPESVQVIETKAFTGCYKLKTLHIPAGVEYIGDGITANCDVMQKITIDPKNEEYIVDTDGALYNRYKSRLVQYPTGKRDVTTFEIPNTVGYLFDHAFGRCQYITSITIPKTVTEFGTWVFLHCKKLKEIKLPPYLEKLNDYMFYGCSALEKLWIPGTPTEFGISLFYSTVLKEVYYDCENPVVARAALFPTNAYNDATLYVPASAVEKAKTTLPWSQFAKIEAYDFTNAGVEEVEVDDPNAPVEVYNLGGIKIADSTDELPAGLYIVRQGGKSKKVSIQ